MAEIAESRLASLESQVEELKTKADSVAALIKSNNGSVIDDELMEVLGPDLEALTDTIEQVEKGVEGIITEIEEYEPKLEDIDGMKCIPAMCGDIHFHADNLLNEQVVEAFEKLLTTVQPVTLIDMLENAGKPTASAPTDFFAQLAALSDKLNLTIRVMRVNDKLTISVLPEGIEDIQPILMTGTTEELNAGFIDAIKKPIASVQGLQVNTTAFNESVEEAENDESAPKVPSASSSSSGNKKKKHKAKPAKPAAKKPEKAPSKADEKKEPEKPAPPAPAPQLLDIS